MSCCFDVRVQAVERTLVQPPGGVGVGGGG